LDLESCGLEWFSISYISSVTVIGTHSNSIISHIDVRLVVSVYKVLYMQSKVRLKNLKVFELKICDKI